MSSLAVQVNKPKEDQATETVTRGILPMVALLVREPVLKMLLCPVSSNKFYLCDISGSPHTVFVLLMQSTWSFLMDKYSCLHYLSGFDVNHCLSG